MKQADGQHLIVELLTDPERFCESGRAIQLLQAYFDGLPKETLRPLLRSENAWVQQSAAFVSSELGSAASGLVGEFPRLLASSNRHVVWYAMEGLAVCAKGEDAGLFAEVLLMLDHPDDALRRLAMRLATRVDATQLEGAGNQLEAQDARFALHTRCLRSLITSSPDEGEIVALLQAPEALARRYGAIGATRFRSQFPGPFSKMDHSDDPDVRSMARK